MTNAYRRVTGDTAPPIEDALVVDDSPLDIRGATVKIHIKPPDGDTIIRDESEGVSIDDAEKGYVTYEFRDGDLSESGRYRYEWQVTFGADDRIVTVPSESEVEFWVRDEIA